MAQNLSSSFDPLALSRDASKGGPAPLLGTLTFLVLGGFVPTLCIALTGSTGNAAWVGALAASVLAGARYSWIVGSRRRRLFEMTTWLYFYLFLGIAPMVQLRDRVDTSTTPNVDHGFDGVAVAIVVVAEVSLIIGSALAARHDRDRPTELNPPRIVVGGRASALAIVLIGVSLIYVALLGPEMLFTSRFQRDVASASVFSDEVVRAIVGALVSMGLLVAVVAQLDRRREGLLHGERPRGMLTLLVAVVLLLIIVNPIASPRYVYGVVVLGLLAAMGAYRTMTGYRTVAIAAVAGMTVLFPVLDSFRSTLDSGVRSVSPLDALRAGDFDSFAQIVNTAWFVDVNGVSGGRQLLGVILFWIPRSVWPGKPVDTGVLLAEAKGYEFTNLSAPLPAELYINGSWWLLIAGMGTLGFLLRYWDSSSEGRIRRLGVPTVLGCVVPFYLILLLRGSLLQSMANLVVIIGVWLLISRPERGSQRKAHPTPPTLSSKEFG